MIFSHIIEPLYLIASIGAIIAMAPQVKRLLTTKRSDELSLAAWSSWVGYQSIALVYAVYIGAVVYMVVNVFWIAFYGIIVALILKYRGNTPSTELPAPELIPVEQPSPEATLVSAAKK